MYSFLEQFSILGSFQFFVLSLVFLKVRWENQSTLSVLLAVIFHRGLWYNCSSHWLHEAILASFNSLFCFLPPATLATVLAPSHYRCFRPQRVAVFSGKSLQHATCPASNDRVSNWPVNIVQHLATYKPNIFFFSPEAGGVQQCEIWAELLPSCQMNTNVVC